MAWRRRRRKPQAGPALAPSALLVVCFFSGSTEDHKRPWLFFCGSPGEFVPLKRQFISRWPLDERHGVGSQCELEVSKWFSVRDKQPFSPLSTASVGQSVTVTVCCVALCFKHEAFPASHGVAQQLDRPLSLSYTHTPACMTMGTHGKEQGGRAEKSAAQSILCLYHIQT